MNLAQEETHLAGPAQGIDVPMRSTIALQVPPQSGAQPSGPMGAADVDVLAGAQLKRAQPADDQSGRLCQVKLQGINPGQVGKLTGVSQGVEGFHPIKG